MEPINNVSEIVLDDSTAVLIFRKDPESDTGGHNVDVLVTGETSWTIRDFAYALLGELDDLQQQSLNEG